MINLLYKGIYGTEVEKEFAFAVMTESRELSNYCQESVRHTHSRRYADALNNIERLDSLELISNAVIAENARKAIFEDNVNMEEREIQPDDPAYLQVMDAIEQGA